MRITSAVAGVPVEVRAGFIVTIGATAGATAILRTPTSGALWLVAASIAVLVHGLGQALVLRTYGIEPQLVLWLLGDHAPAPRLERGSRVTVLLAGPATCLVLGMPLVSLAMRGVIGDGVGGEALLLAGWALVGWATCTLVPLLPLTGGELVVEAVGRRRPSVVRRRVLHASVVAGAGGAGCAALVGQPLIAAALGLVACWDLGCARGWWRGPCAPRSVVAGGEQASAPPWEASEAAVPAALVDAVRALQLGAGADALRSLDGIDHHAQAPIVRRFARELTGWANVQVGDLDGAAAAADALAGRDAGRGALRAAIALVGEDPEGPALLADSLRDRSLGRQVRGFAAALAARCAVATEVAVALLAAGDLEAALDLQHDLEAAGRRRQAVAVEQLILEL